MKLFNITSSFKAQGEDDNGITIRGMASTADFDRAGDVILPDAWTKGGLTNFLKNPIILFNHDYRAPIGKGTVVEANAKGLELEAYISKHAANGVWGLIKDGILGAFSVGFQIKDADYIEETGGLLIKEAELFEVSVVSVPCNQDATFSIAKSFDSEAEYEEFTKTFTTRVDLAGQSLAKKGVNTPDIASNTPDGGNNPQLENEMDKKELEALLKKVAEDTARGIALKQAEKDAADAMALKAKTKAEAEAKATAEAVALTIKTGLESGTEKLLADFDAKLTEKDTKLEEALAKFGKDLEDKSDEIAALRKNKGVFVDRNKGSGDISAWGKDFLGAHLLGVITGKGMATDFAVNLMEKAGVDYVTSAADIDQEVASQIEKEVQVNTKVANMFREITVNGAATVLPIQPDVDKAVWQGAPAYALNEGDVKTMNADGVTPDSGFDVMQVILNAYRLVSSSYLDNDIDEQVLINIMPMLIDSVARAHAKAVENVILMGNGTITGLDGYSTLGATQLATAAVPLTAANLMTARKSMGKFGIDPSDVAYIVSVARYYELIEDSAFDDVSEVGDLATKVKGAVGAVYGSPVVISNEFPAEAAGAPVAFAVNARNFAIPRLRGIKVEQDYEVGKQRRLIVASQSLGFEELVRDYASNRSSVKIDITA